MRLKFFNQYLIIFLILSQCLNIFCVKIPPKLCDNNYIDAVLWDGITYRVTRNEWIAYFDENTQTVGQFFHKSLSDFQNDYNMYYQSGYYIPNVPECDTTLKSCLEMKRLIGLTVYTIRDSITGDIFYKTSRTKIIKSVFYELNTNHYFDSKLSSKLSKELREKYRPSVYIPNDNMFIHITNENRNSGPIIESIQLHENGLIERNSYDIIEPKNMVFITAFWWKFHNKVYIIAEDKRGFGNAFVYELIKKNNGFDIKPTNIKMLDFFGCNEPKTSISTNNDLIENRFETTLTESDNISETTKTIKSIVDKIAIDSDMQLWQILIIILYLVLLSFSVFIILFGVISVYYFRILFSKKSVTNIKSVSDKKKKKTTSSKLLLENYETSPKYLVNSSIDDFSCQTSLSDEFAKY